MSPKFATLSAADLDKLASILALLSSDKPGEVGAAAAAAQRLLTRHGLTFRDLAARPAPAPSPHFSLFDNWPERWRAATHICLQAPNDLLTGLDRRFLQTIARYEHRPSQKQLDWLARILGDILAVSGGAK